MKEMMLKMMTKVTNYFRSEKGQGMVEYGLIIGLVAIVLIVALTTLGGEIGNVFGRVSDELKEVAPTPTS